MATAKRPPKASAAMKANASKVLGGGKDALGSRPKAASQPKGFSGGKWSNKIAKGGGGGIRRDRKGRFT
jgi:hypothetical protein